MPMPGESGRKLNDGASKNCQLQKRDCVEHLIHWDKFY